ncbi:MAG: PEP-CTERM-box response regulator transcription factor [Deltaproteobacteria bacterium]|nr:PEP-CTERM-box response regulator transcription factor [Deltaproteobacteria bacterium]
MSKQGLLIVDDEAEARNQLRWSFSEEYEIFEAANRDEALALAHSARPGVVILDLRLPPSLDDASEGFKTVQDILQSDPLSKILISTGIHEKETALKAIDLGVFDLFTKPLDLDELKITVKRASRLYSLQKENNKKREQDRGMLGSSEPMKEVLGLIQKVAPVNVPVLILGESGTGKELAAKEIHSTSDRRDKPFIVINCGAIPENLLETELFGYEKGSFTGAESQKKGKIEYAEGGTLFLDEIGELSQTLQVKLLRFLQEQTIERVGGREPIIVDTRIISATNKDLEAMARTGEFREDLYFRLGVIVLKMPPLRERGADIFTLSLAFLNKFSKEYNRTIKGFSVNAVTALKQYAWPGNIRELENKIKRAVALCRMKEISPEDLDLPSPESTRAAPSGSMAEAKEEFRKKLIHEALFRNKGVISKSAKELGISRQYLSKLISKYNLKPK